MSVPEWMPPVDGGGEHDAAGWMALALDIALRSAENGGGPFGAVVVDASGRRALGVGWNAVVATHDSTAHAEIVAIRAAQAKLGAHGLAGCALYSSCEPCIQCYGAIYWSGLATVYASLARAEAEALGFDEGPVSDELWGVAQAKRGIKLVRGLGSERPDARAALDRYRALGGPIY